jgi:hypothetical protein
MRRDKMYVNEAWRGGMARMKSGGARCSALC